MQRKIVLAATTLLFGGIVSFVSAQTPSGGIKPSVATGDVVSINKSEIVLQTKDGQIDITLSEKTDYKRVPPDNPSLKAAVSSAFSDIGSGDKLMVTGFFSEDKKTLPARAVYLMTKSDIAQKQAKEHERWSTRGISGRIVSVNAQTGQINIEIRGLLNATAVVLTPKADVKFLRYAPNSVKYDEAIASSFAELQKGDMVRALGDKSLDGASFAAEEIISGAFQTVAGTVKTVDSVKNEVVITDLQTKKDVTVALGSASVLKKFPAEMAQRMATAQTAGARTGGQGSGSQTANGPGGQGQPQGSPGRSGGGQRSGGIDDMLERFPNITVADLKPGDMIAVSSTKNGNVDRITAIKLLAGVEPFIRAAQATGGGQRSQSLSIPGLEGLDFP